MRHLLRLSLAEHCKRTDFAAIFQRVDVMKIGGFLGKPESKACFSISSSLLRLVVAADQAYEGYRRLGLIWDLYSVRIL